MSLIDAYYKFEKPDNASSKTRFDLAAFTETYEAIHKTNSKGLVTIYLSEPDNIRASRRRLPDKRITNCKGNHVSGIFLPEPEQPRIGYGDIKGTTDALLVLMNEKSLEIFIAKGKKHSISGLYYLMIDGELDAEIESLRKQARPFLTNDRSM
jgi:hypothetical protein